MASVIEMFIQEEEYLNEQLLNTPIKLQIEIRDYIGGAFKFPLTTNYLKTTSKKDKLNILTVFYRRSPDYINDPEDYLIDKKMYDEAEYAKWYWAPLLKIWPELSTIVNEHHSKVGKTDKNYSIERFFNGFPPRQGGEGGLPSFERYCNFYDKYRRAVLKDFLDMYSPNTKWNLEEISYNGEKEIEIYDLKLEKLEEIMWSPYADYSPFLLYKLEEDAFPPIFWFKINTLKKRPFMNYWELPWDTVK
tara:strand:- start:16616 stop:17356 length:741 start_codon:yes stop_codon:yes gene_type:complete